MDRGSTPPLCLYSGLPNPQRREGIRGGGFRSKREFKAEIQGEEEQRGKVKEEGVNDGGEEELSRNE